MSTFVITGDRIGKGAKISTGCSATIFSMEGDKLLLTKRTDNKLWCLPGGRIEGGEDIKETCIREVKEETGFDVTIKKLIGIYTSPNMIVQYPDGNQVQIVAFNFEAKIQSGNFKFNDEVSEIDFFSEEELSQIDIFEIHKERIFDAFKYLPEVIIK